MNTQKIEIAINQLERVHRDMNDCANRFILKDAIDQLQEQVKLFAMPVVSGSFCVGDIVRIRPMFENDEDREKHYVIKETKGDRAFIIWENYYSDQARPFWIDKRSIERVGK